MCVCVCVNIVIELSRFAGARRTVLHEKYCIKLLSFIVVFAFEYCLHVSFYLTAFFCAFSHCTPFWAGKLLDAVYVGEALFIKTRGCLLCVQLQRHSILVVMCSARTKCQRSFHKQHVVQH